MMEIWTELTLELSHTLDEPIGYPTLHGHSYWVRVFVSSSVDNPVPLPMLEGFAKLLLQKVDHTHMNDWLKQPTMESLAAWIAENMQGPKVTRVQIERKSIGAGVDYRP